MLRIRVNDYRDYNAETCNNGGNYAFFTTYTEMPDGRFRIEYDTTADFPYCSVCGSFHDGHCHCDDMEDPWTYVTREEALKAYENAQNNPDDNYYGEIITVVIYDYEAELEGKEVSGYVCASDKDEACNIIINHYRPKRYFLWTFEEFEKPEDCEMKSGEIKETWSKVY